jgi:hypothetical protein
MKLSKREFFIAAIIFIVLISIAFRVWGWW